MSQSQIVRPVWPWAFPSGEAANALSSGTHAVITPLALSSNRYRPPGASVPPTGRNQRPMRWAFVEASQNSAPAVR